MSTQKRNLKQLIERQTDLIKLQRNQKLTIEQSAELLEAKQLLSVVYQKSVIQQAKTLESVKSNLQFFAWVVVAGLSAGLISIFI